MTEPPRYLLLGSGGMLGSTFKARLAEKEVLCASGQNIIVQDLSTFCSWLKATGTKTVINCAADTDVEGGEHSRDRAFLANALLPDLLAQACATVGCKLVHFSSTGCYGDYKSEPYGDYDELRPTTVHHQSKAAGERAIRETNTQSLILRLGWLYGGPQGAKKNFVAARLQEAHRTSELASDPTQVGCPTNVEDVVAQTLALLDTSLSGTFNCVAQGAGSRFDYVKAIMEGAGLEIEMVERKFDRCANVSRNEAASNDKLRLLGLDRMPCWKEALGRYVRSLRPFAGDSHEP